MLQKLVLRNFQKHKKLEIEFDPHITTIIGRSDAGKSAILRSLYWLTFNRPSGESFRRHGSKFTSVELHLPNVRIKRKKGKSNSYYLEESHFKAFGSGVPPEVSQTLGFSELNFQRQHDGPFWFTDSPGQVAKNLNSIIDLSIIDSVLSNVTRKTRTALATVDVCHARIQEARNAVRDLKWVENCDVQLQALEQNLKAIEKANQYGAELCYLLDEVKRHRQLVKTAEGAKELGSKVVKLGDKFLKLEAKRKVLRSLIESSVSIKLEISQCQKQIEETQERIQKETQGRCPLCQGPLKMAS